MESKKPTPDEITRRQFVEGAVLVPVLGASLCEAQTSAPDHTHRCALTINKIKHELNLDSRVTLLDLLREQLHLTGTKKGCDHGQCGACTVLVNGQRINSCLTLAVSVDGDEVTTIEGLGVPGRLHPMQAAFIEHDGFQCGFCTSGQICSAVAMLEEARAGMPSFVTKDLNGSRTRLNEDEVRERMAGNICRCGAYPNIVAAVLSVSQEGDA
jgi:xanthine dehydrogenase YagT iron-sulfur-binding subunit